MALDDRMLAQVIALLGDGLFWRRAIDPAFDAKATMPAVMGLVAKLLNPVTGEEPPVPISSEKRL